MSDFAFGRDRINHAIERRVACLNTARQLRLPLANLEVGGFGYICQRQKGCYIVVARHA